MQTFLDLKDRNIVGIFIDHRENPDFDDLLKSAGAEVRRTVLAVGDFICSDRLAVERKTRDDFEASIIDGRLFTQIPHLKENYERVVIIVEGEAAGSVRISREALLGAYGTIISDYGCSLFFTRDNISTAEVVYALAKHEQLAERRPLRLYARRKAHTVSQSQRAIVETFPMVGPQLAKNLLKHFTSLEAVINASEKELMLVDGMGKKRAKAIRNIIENGYLESEDP